MDRDSDLLGNEKYFTVCILIQDSAVEWVNEDLNQFWLLRLYDMMLFT